MLIAAWAGLVEGRQRTGKLISFPKWYRNNLSAVFPFTKIARIFGRFLSNCGIRFGVTQRIALSLAPARRQEPITSQSAMRLFLSRRILWG